MFSSSSLALSLMLAAGLLIPPASDEQPGVSALVGRWDLTVGSAPQTYPSWLEIGSSAGRLEGRFVGKVGSVRTVTEIVYSNGTLMFSLPPQYEKTKEKIVFIGTLSDDRLSGKTRGEDGDLPWLGVRAPELPWIESPLWGEPIRLFNGTDLAGWKPRDPNLPFGWKAVDGILENTMPSSDIVTEQDFTDFRLRLEFKLARRSNSGIYLRGRYEVQIQDDYGKPPGSLLMGGVYGFVDPEENAARKAEEWQDYEITLLGRFVTVRLNGQTVIDRKEIPGITGGALDSNEGEPGPLMLQGDHGNVSFRNIELTPVRR